MSMSFKAFLIEENKDLADRIANFEHEIDTYIKAGEIMKPQYEILKGQLDRAIEKEAEQISVEHTHGKGMVHYEIDPTLGDLSYAVPNSVREIASLKNKLARIKSQAAKDTPFYKAVLAYYNKRKDLAEKLAKLKTLVVTTKQKRAVAKEVKQKEFQKTYNDASTLVKVLEQNIDAYVKRAGEMAAAQFDSWMDTMKANDWDLDKVAPKPKTTMRTDQYRMMQSKRMHYEGATDRVEGQGNIRKYSEAKKKKHIEQSKKNAHAAYMEWVKKMVQKIGKAVQHAEMTGNPWVESTLRVTGHDGEKQVWKSKMIINRSKYNTLFNQFPSRRVDKKDSID
jgi:hypothetical protein